MRSQIVRSMRAGMHLAIDLQNVVVPLKDKYDVKSLPLSSLIFDREKLFKHFIKIVKEEEKTNQFGIKDEFKILDGFDMVLLVNMSGEFYDDEILQSVLDQLPNEENFLKVFINPQS
mmetsp:Transcript_5525/g.9414  ORF Transcript_5525/g.9414 Transcript_5525/m.9414 type:complete len:117 (-) Transcript_5525:88-438(-)